jgi:hypothetical protein
MPSSIPYRFWALITLLTSISPAFADLRITTRSSWDGKHASRNTTYLSGERQRSEVHSEDPSMVRPETALVYQCDQKRVLELNQQFRTYSYSPLDENGRPVATSRWVPAENTGKGGDVTVTIDSVDTGEHKLVGSYTARHVKSTIQVEAGSGACAQNSLTKIEGWYVELPYQFACRKQAQRTGFVFSNLGNCHDKLTIKRLGEAESGYPLDVTTTRTEAGRATVTRIELLDFSEVPLDKALFELPTDYRPAMHTSTGYDFTRPDTFGTRVGHYWAQLKSAVAHLWP